MKNKLIVGIIAFIILAGLGFLIYFGVIQSALQPTQATTYSSAESSLDGKTLTYSGLWRYEDFRGLQARHSLSDECSQTDGCYFPSGVGAKWFFPFYLEINGIDFSNFNPGGYKQTCVFSPETYGDKSYEAELNSIGFTYYDTTTYHTEYVGDYSSCGNCPQCATSGCPSTMNRCCASFERAIPTQQSDCYTGNYQISNLESNKNKLVCSVQGNSFNIQGQVEATGTGFYCIINVNSAKEDYPNIDIEFKNSNPRVVFTFAETKTYYRFENNQCTSITILENEKTENDYDSLIECQNKIVIEETKTYYRFSDNSCSQVNLKESEKTANDYETLSECQSKIIVEENEVTVYRLENNVCNLYVINENEKLDSDYTSLSKCEKNIIPEDTSSEKQINTKLISWIAGIILGIFIIILIFILSRRK